MISCSQFRKYIIRPVLEAFDLWSADAEEILIATMAHESLGGTYLVQENSKGQRVMKGGIGPYQIEPATYQVILMKYSRKIDKSIFPGINRIGADLMMEDLSFATFIARLNYLRFEEPLPDANDIEAIWLYYKKYWNSYLGKAVKEDFMRNYQNFTERKS